MESWAAVAAGITCGLAGSIPQAVLFEIALRGQAGATVSAGLLSVVASYVLLTLALLVVWIVAPAQELTFGVALVAAHQVFWWAEAIRAWRAANAR